jgi:oligoribonuclease NrnB/cAMP/cGMP phosphodiesterase (DHH superfamily)
MGGDAEYYAAYYGQDPPDCKGRKVWLLDFTYPRKVLFDKVLIPSTQTTIYDHHKSAEADLQGIKNELWDRGVQRDGDKIIFDMQRSGAGITYDDLEAIHGKKKGFHLPRYNGERRQRLIDYIEDRDIWNWKLPNSKEVSAWITTVPMTFKDYDALAEDLNLAPGFDDIVSKGAAILAYIDLFGEKACASARFESIGTYKVPTINIQYMNSSDHLHKLQEIHPDAPFVAGYHRRLDGKWQFGLRSIGDFDVSEVAKTYGGGGHKNAAGFQVEWLPWEKLPDVNELKHVKEFTVRDYVKAVADGEGPAHYKEVVDAQGVESDAKKGKISGA